METETEKYSTNCHLTKEHFDVLFTLNSSYKKQHEIDIYRMTVLHYQWDHSLGAKSSIDEVGWVTFKLVEWSYLLLSIYCLVTN